MVFFFIKWEFITNNYFYLVVKELNLVLLLFLLKFGKGVFFLVRERYCNLFVVRVDFCYLVFLMVLLKGVFVVVFFYLRN